MLVIVFFIFLFAVVTLFLAVGTYNALVTLRNQVDRAWANIEVILKQRFDEIPQLLQVVEQYAQHERATIDRIATARAHYGSARGIREKVTATNEMSTALRGITAIGEAYPELRSNRNFVQLQSRVSRLESDIADRREGFNEAVATFNTRTQQFPDLIFAAILGYRRQEFLAASASERVPPSLKMDFGS